MTLSGGISTNGKDVYLNSAAVISSDADGAFADRSGSNIDHIWHNDGDNAWNFCSDTTYKNSGNSRINAGSFYGNGANLTNVNATPLDSIDSGSFVRSDASDTLTGATYTLNSATDQKIILSGSSSPYIRFQEGGTNKAYIQWHSSGHLQLVNQESGEYLRISNGVNGLTFTVDGTSRTVWHSGNLAPMVTNGNLSLIHI